MAAKWLQTETDQGNGTLFCFFGHFSIFKVDFRELCDVTCTVIVFNKAESDF